MEDETLILCVIALFAGIVIGFVVGRTNGYQKALNEQQNARLRPFFTGRHGLH